jgi:hypothetical protein
MDRARKLDLLARLEPATAPQAGPLGASSLRNPAAAYTDSARFTRERERLFRGWPCRVNLSVECEAWRPPDGRPRRRARGDGPTARCGAS